LSAYNSTPQDTTLVKAVATIPELNVNIFSDGLQSTSAVEKKESARFIRPVIVHDRGNYEKYA